MKQKLQGKLNWLMAGLVVGSLFGGVAVAKVVIPDHSVGWSSLKKGLQKRIAKNSQATRGLRGPRGPRGKKGNTGPAGARGPAGEVVSPPEPPRLSGPFVKSLAVASIGGDSAILEADINTEGAEDGVYYQFQLATDPADFRPELSCPQRADLPPVIGCLGSILTDGGSTDILREPEDLPTRDLPASASDQHVRLEAQGLDPEREYHYRLVVVEREQGVDNIEWFSPPTHSPSRSFTTADVDSPRAYGWVAPFGGPEEILKRSRNAYLVEPDGDPAGIWCIVPEGIDPSKAIVQLTPVQEPHVSLYDWEVPVVRWQTSPNHCEEDQVEIETTIYDGFNNEYVDTDVPFTFVIEESR